MYVSPVHAIMILHNIETNEEIWDYKATDKALERVVRENIVELEGIAAKNKASEERKEAWENMIRTRSNRYTETRVIAFDPLYSFIEIEREKRGGSTSMGDSFFRRFGVRVSCHISLYIIA